MGGFLRDYVDDSQTQLYTATVDDNQIDNGGFYRIDDDRQLVIFSSEYSRRVWGCVVTTIDPPAFDVGTVVDLATDDDLNYVSVCYATRLDETSWLVYQSGADNWVRISVVGDVVSVIDRGNSSFMTFPAPYDAAPWSTSGSVMDGVAGIDHDHVLVPVSFYNSSNGHTYEGWGVVELVPGNDESLMVYVVRHTVEVDYGWQAMYHETAIEPGVSYWRVTDFWSGSGYFGATALARITATPSSITLETVDADTDFVNALNDTAFFMSRAADGRYWMLGEVVSDDTWSIASPYKQHVRMHVVDGLDRTDFVYTTEALAANNDLHVVAGSNLMANFKSTFATDDTHWRNERLVADTLPGSLAGTAPLAAGAVHYGSGFFLALYTDFDVFGTPLTPHVFLAMCEEIPQPPIVNYTFDPDSGDAPLEVAFDGTLAIGNTRDSYWHPITGWHWYFDDGIDLDGSDPTVTHTYTRPSAGHVSGSSLPPGAVGFGSGNDGYYWPALIVTSSAGSSPLTGIFRLVEVLGTLIPPPLAHRQRRDGVAAAGPQLAHVGTPQPSIAHRQNTP